MADTAPRTLIVRRAATALVGLVIVGAGAVGCSGKGNHASGTAGSGSTAGTANTTATTATSSTTTVPAGPTMGFPTNEQAADHLLNAWKAGDHAAAAQGATPGAVATMFTVPVGQLNVRGCDAGEFDTSSCVYRVLSNQWELQINLSKQANGWIVSDVSYSPPS